MILSWIKSRSSQCRPYFYLIKIDIIWGRMKMEIIYSWGFCSTLSWLHADWIVFWWALSPNVPVNSAFVATNWNDKIIYFFYVINENKIMMHHVVAPRASKHNCHQTPCWRIAWVINSSYSSDPSGSNIIFLEKCRTMKKIQPKTVWWKWKL